MSIQTAGSRFSSGMGILKDRAVLSENFCWDAYRSNGTAAFSR